LFYAVLAKEVQSAGVLYKIPGLFSAVNLQADQARLRKRLVRFGLTGGLSAVQVMLTFSRLKNLLALGVGLRKERVAR
jgi:hypothetical protein